MDDAQCAEVIVPLDDVAFSDPGQTCGWTSLGCYTDSVSMRALNNHGMIAGWPSTTTVEACQAACQAQGFSYAGVEFGNECWCGNELSSSPAADGCNMLCSGNSQEICGGPDRLNVYYRPQEPVGVWLSGFVLKDRARVLKKNVGDMADEIQALLNTCT